MALDLNGRSHRYPGHSPSANANGDCL